MAGRGPAPYVLIAAYAAIVSALLLSNPTTGLGADMVVVLFLLLMFVIYRAPTMLAFKLTLGTILLAVVMPVFGVLNPFYIDVVTKAGMFAALGIL
jgi:amino acid/amide ABC transporter membrane protein 2, HAAT family (TC 3.A.1.4.-)